MEFYRDLLAVSGARAPAGAVPFGGAAASETLPWGRLWLGGGLKPGASDRDRIRALADAGDTGAAWRTLRVALDAAPTDPALRFYEGLLARALGRDVEAERALRAALYLDRGFVMAHYHLGLLLIARDRPDEAARALDNAVALSQAVSEALGPDTALPEGDGASAAEIAAGASVARAALERRSS